MSFITWILITVTLFIFIKDILHHERLLTKSTLTRQVEQVLNLNDEGQPSWVDRFASGLTTVDTANMAARKFHAPDLMDSLNRHQDMLMESLRATLGDHLDIDVAISQIDDHRVDSTWNDGEFVIFESHHDSMQMMFVDSMQFVSHDTRLKTQLYVSQDSFRSLIMNQFKWRLLLACSAFLFLTYLLISSITRLFKLQEVKHEQGAFLGDLKTMIAKTVQSVQVASATQLRHLAEDRTEDAKKLGSFIYSQSSRLNQMMDDIAQDGTHSEIVLNYRDVSMSQLIDDSIRDTRIKYKEGHYSIEVNIDPPVLTIESDPHYLKSVFLVLLDNAISYNQGDDNLLIEIIVRRINDHIIIKISDNGVGVDKNQMQFLGEKFYRSSEYSHVPGLGLGLYQVKRIIHSFQGTIRFTGDSTAGLSIEIRLPGQPIRKIVNQ